MRIIFCLFTLFCSVASADYKIAVVDMEFAIQGTSDGKEAKNRLTKEFKLLEGKLKKREFGLMEKVKNFEKKAMILSESKRAEQRAEIQKLSINFQKDMQAFQASIQQKQIEATKPIIAKLEKQISSLAKEKGYDVVLNKSMNNVLWVKKAIDITKIVIQRYEASKKRL